MQGGHGLKISRRDTRSGLRACLSALLAALLLAFSAAAARAETPAGQGSGETQESGPGASEAQGAGQESPAGAEQGPGSGETPSEGLGSGEAPAEVAESPAEPPATETQPPPQPGEPAGGDPPPSEPEAPGGPSAGSTPEGGEAVLPPTSQQSEEQAPGRAGEETAGVSSTHPTEPAATGDVRSAVLETLSGPPGPTSGSPTSADQVAVVSAERETAQAGTSQRSVLAIASRQAGRFSCELSALGGSKTDNCTAGWLASSPSIHLAAPASAAVSAVSSLLAAGSGNSPTGGGHGGFATSGPPLSPAPGPSPSGASGGVGATAPGAGVSIFLTLAGLLLLGAPRALRRLRRAFEPWLAGCFVLIPERPD